MKEWYGVLLVILVCAIVGLSEYRVNGRDELISLQEEYIQTLEEYANTSEQTLVKQNKKICSLQNDVKKLTKTQSNWVVNAVVTSYSPREEETDEDPYLTASMEPVREGCVAVSRDLFYKGWSFGRKVYIEGEGVFTITDLMHARKTNQVDIFRFNTEAALEFGRQQRKVVLLGQGKL